MIIVQTQGSWNQIRLSISCELQAIEIKCQILFSRKVSQNLSSAAVLIEALYFQFKLQEVDITLPENELWYNKYKNDIPVFHMHEDFLFMHRVDTNILEKALKEFENKSWYCWLTACWVIFHAFLLSADFYQNLPFQNIHSGILSIWKCQTNWIQIRMNIMSVLIWVQTVCKVSSRQQNCC